MIVGLRPLGSFYNRFRKLLRLRLRLSQELKRRRHQEFELIGVKVRRPSPVGLKIPLAGDQPFGRHADDLREQNKLLAADALTKLPGGDGGAGDARPLGDLILTKTSLEARVTDALADRSLAGGGEFPN